MPRRALSDCAVLVSFRRAAASLPVALAVGHRLVGDPGVMGRNRAGPCERAPQKRKSAWSGRPWASGTWIPQLHDRHALGHRDGRRRPRGDGPARLDGIGRSGPAAPPRCRSAAGGATGAGRSGRGSALRGALARRPAGFGILAAAGQARGDAPCRSPRCGHAADLGGDLARAQALGPELLEELDPLVRPGYARIFISICLHRGGLTLPESLMHRGQGLCPTASRGSLLRGKPPHECRTRQALKLLDGWTPAQESPNRPLLVFPKELDLGTQPPRRVMGQLHFS